MKTSNAIWLFVLIFFLVLSFFLFLNKSASKDTKLLTLGEVSSCQSEKIADSVWHVPANTILVRAFISFKEFPLPEVVQQNFTEWGVSLDQNSLVFDNMWATIPVARLCDIADLDQVTSIFTLE